MSFRLVAFHYPKPEHHDEMIRRITRAAEVMTTVPGCLEADCWKEESSKCRGGHRDVRIQRSLHTRLRSCCRRQRRYRLRRPRVRPQRRLQPDRDELRHGRHRAHLCPEGFKTLIHAGNHSFPGGTVVLEPQGVLSSSRVCARQSAARTPSKYSADPEEHLAHQAERCRDRPHGARVLLTFSDDAGTGRT